MRESVLHKVCNSGINILGVIALCHLFLSWQYLLFYLYYWNETSYMDRPWWEEVSCTRSITLASLCLELFPFVTLFFSGQYFLLYLYYWNETSYMDRSLWDEMSCTRSITLASIFLKLFPFVTFSCPEDNSCSADAIVMKFHPWTEYDQGRHHV